MSTVGISNFTRKPCIIGAGLSKSDVINVLGSVLVGVVIPSNWTLAPLSFQGSVNAGSPTPTYQDLYEDDGTEIVWLGAAADRILITRAGEPILGGLERLIVRSGTAASPVLQVSTVTLQLLLAVVNP